MQRMRRALSMKGYDRNFKLFLYAMAGMQAYQAILVTLTKEVKDSLPYVTEIAQIANISATGWTVSAVAMLGWSYLGERYPRKALLLVAGSVGISAFAAAIYAPNYQVMFALHVVSFAGRSAFLALSPAILMDMTPAGERGTASSVMGVVVLAGMAMGTVMPSFLVDHLGFQIPMLILVAFSGTGLCALAFAKLPKRGAQERALAESLRGSARYNRTLDWGGLRRVFGVRSNRYMFLFYAVMMISLGGVGYYMFTIFKEEYAMSATTTMLLVMVAQFPTMMGTAYWGPKSDEAAEVRRDGRIRTLVTGALLATVFRALSYIVLPLFLISPWYLGLHIAFSLVAAWANNMALVPIMDAIVGDTNPPELRSITISVRQLVSVLTTSVGIIIVGSMQARQGTFTWATIALSVVGMFSVLALLPARHHVTDEMDDLDRLMEQRGRELVAEQGA
jgi:MFS family permease